MRPDGTQRARGQFQSTPSQRGRLHIGVTSAILYGISIHALAKRATLLHEPRLPRSSYFNPRPRKEGDLAGYAQVLRRSYISIHALVKRATYKITTALSLCSISIHALVKRATRAGMGLIRSTPQFQSTPS